MGQLLAQNLAPVPMLFRKHVAPLLVAQMVKMGEVKTESVNVDCPLLVGTLFPFPDHQFEFSWGGQTDKTS